MQTMIHVKNIKKKFGNVTAVDGISFEVHKGKLVSLLGPNGAGKSTIINIMCTLLQADGGTASICDFDVQRDKMKVRQVISVMPQELVFYDHLSAVDNLVFFATMHGVPKRVASTRAKVVLEQLGINGRKDIVKNFSGGMKRRLNLGISTVMDTGVLFLDEPSAGLDPQAKHRVWEYINELKVTGKTIILTTHDMGEAERLSDQVIIIDQGKIIAEGTPAGLRQMYGNETILELELKNGRRDILARQLELKPYVTRVMQVNQDGLIVFLKRVNAMTFKEPMDSNGTGLEVVMQTTNIARVIKMDLIDHLDDIDSMNVRQGTLEDVFLNLTGRRLRE
nr:ABC transporter ATP-binding protein [Candidatus Sigynarchaeota archaeon]